MHFCSDLEQASKNMCFATKKKLKNIFNRFWAYIVQRTRYICSLPSYLIQGLCVVLACFQNDDFLQSLFIFEGISCKDWCDSIVINGRRTFTFDVIVFAYLLPLPLVII